MLSSNITLYEISWEICSKDGGIYTVITSKQDIVNNQIKNYYQLGPLREKSKNHFIEKPLPQNLKQAKQNLENQGIILHYGTSNKNKQLKIILIEYLGHSNHINQIKTQLWENYQIDSLNSNWYDFDEAILWSWCCGKTIEEIENSKQTKTNTKNQNPVLIHAHEWMSGGAIFYANLHLDQTKYKTIFTTHATMLGRSLSSNNIDITNNPTFDPNEYSYQIGVSTKHQTEKTLATISNCFTTVSDQTNKEASYIYGKSADIILYNGFNNKGIENLEILNAKFAKSRKKINQQIKTIFKTFPNLNLDKTKIFYTSGRNEYKNKGFDIYIKALSKLNEQLKTENSEITLINFFLIPIGNFEPIDFTNHDEIPLKTHCIQNHEILTELKNNNLENLPSDKVINLLIPQYLDGNDGIINTKYYDFITGFDLGIFASYYEPWGYTPLESISYAVPTITSNLAGFGQHIEKTYGDFNPSVMVLKRKTKTQTRQIQQLYNLLYNQLTRNQKSQILQREFAKLTALKYDWQKFIKNYYKAYEFALNKKNIKKQSNTN